MEKLDVHEIGSYLLLNSTKKYSHYIQFILNPPQTKSFSYIISLLICAMYVVCVFFVITLFFLIVIFAYSFYHICVGSQIILSQILAIQNNNHTQNTNIYVENPFSLKGKTTEKPRDKLRIISILSNQLQ